MVQKEAVTPGAPAERGQWSTLVNFVEGERERKNGNGNLSLLFASYQ